MRLNGARVLVTGATGGLGEAIARALAERGAKLVLTGRRTEVLQPLATALSAEMVIADLAKRSELNRLVNEVGAVDVLVANAAVAAFGALGDFTVTQIDRTIDVNLRAPVLLARALSGGMAQRGRGHIVMVSSLSGIVASPGSALYSATKFGLRGFAHALRQDLAASGVGVSVVLPGFVRGAGMFARSKVRLPSAIRTSTPDDVARGVWRAIERDRAEVLVAPPELKVGALLGGAAPRLSAILQGRAGAGKVSANLAKRQGDAR
jgi:uncharacterized protein